MFQRLAAEEDSVARECLLPSTLLDERSRLFQRQRQVPQIPRQLTGSALVLVAGALHQELPRIVLGQDVDILFLGQVAPHLVTGGDQHVALAPAWPVVLEGTHAIVGVKRGHRIVEDEQPSLTGLLCPLEVTEDRLDSLLLVL